MTQNEKDLLLKDLCARLPYGVKFVIDNGQNNVRTLTGICEAIPYEDWQMCVFARDISAIPIEDIKPYLFPLSSMTEEQKEEISKRYNYHNPYELCVEITNHSEGYWDNDTSCNLQDYLWLEDWFNKNHFDYRGLIPMGLAIDATGLKIY